MTTEREDGWSADLWRHYHHLLDLYKFYLELTLKVHAYYYALSGAVATFYLAQREDRLMALALVLPVALGLSLAYLAWQGAVLARRLRDELKRVGGELGLPVFPEAKLLVTGLRLSTAAFLVVAAASIALAVVE